MSMLAFTLSFAKKNYRGLLSTSSVKLILLLTTILAPWANSYLIDTVITSGEIARLWSFASIFLLINMTDVIFNLARPPIQERFQQILSLSILDYLLEHLKSLPLSNHKSFDPNYISQRVFSDSASLSNFFVFTLLESLFRVIGVIFYFCYLLQYDFRFLALIMLTWIIYLFIFYKTKGVVFLRAKASKDSISILVSIINRQLIKMPFIKINSVESQAKDNLLSSYNLTIKKIISHVLVVTHIEVTWKFLNILVLLTTTLIAATAVMKGTMTLGKMQMIAVYSTGLLNALGYFANMGTAWQNAKASYSRISELLKLPVEPRGGESLHSIDHLELREVFINHQNAHRTTPVSTYLKRGKIYALIGASGTGKTSLLYSIAGVSANYQGEIKMNGKNIKELDMQSVRKNLISFLDQESTLLFDTIGENLTYHAGLFTRLGLTHLTPETLVANLSGGERQRLAMARLLQKNHDLLILDEPTSSLDDQTAKIFMKLLQQHKHNKIILLITHAQALIEECDDIIPITIDCASYLEQPFQMEKHVAEQF
ncbi:MAG: ATP-binding cassette domain-containing protein [Oligoflexia bacterium]|nr:ATP-binding cassette domain-containing protein [Oligoflexia bacterium]